MAERCRDLTKLIDLATKLARRVVDIAVKELEARESDFWANADINKARKALAGVRAGAVEAVRQARYFVRQADWLQDRFPKAELRDVEGVGEASRPQRDRGARLEPDARPLCRCRT